jgi:hypothetical protein
MQLNFVERRVDTTSNDGVVMRMQEQTSGNATNPVHEDGTV